MAKIETKTKFGSALVESLREVAAWKRGEIAAGCLEHKIATGMRPDGTEWSSSSVRVMPRGLTVLAKAFPSVATASLSRGMSSRCKAVGGALRGAPILLRGYLRRPVHSFRKGVLYSFWIGLDNAQKDARCRIRLSASLFPTFQGSGRNSKSRGKLLR